MKGKLYPNGLDRQPVIYGPESGLTCQRGLTTTKAVYSAGRQCNAPSYHGRHPQADLTFRLQALAKRLHFLELWRGEGTRVC